MLGSDNLSPKAPPPDSAKLSSGGDSLCADCHYKPAATQGVCDKCRGIRNRRAAHKIKAKRHDYLRNGHPGRVNKNHTVPDRFICNPEHRVWMRTELLRTMGFRSYTDYSHSELWSGIRARVTVRDKGQCQACPRSGCDVHHLDYDYATMNGECLDRLVLLCKNCHSAAERQRAALLKQKRRE